MSVPILATKLYFPPARANLVPRSRLVERLEAGLRKPLTLISAPAGYGKTTLLCEWRAGSGSKHSLAWLSLEPGDNNLARFLYYISAALDTLDPNIAQDLVAQLQIHQLPPVEELITLLINGAYAFPRDFALILDDYHAIQEPDIHTALSYLLDHMPLNMHLVLLTRSDPPIHLAKLRADDRMVELRADDLRFTHEETTTFLNIVMDLGISAENIGALDQRTEGWIVGLQMAALSMQGKADVTAFITAFTGSNRYILDYFAEEVISRLPASMQTFLLQTSILDRLSGPLCDTVLGESKDSAQVLEELERKNLFLIPLDDERQWYRYHHLFTELLFLRLKQTLPEMVNELYMRAATWLEKNGYLESAVGYALKAQDYENATRLLNQIKYNLANRGDVRMLISWLNTLPEVLLKSEPELCFGYASMLAMEGCFEEAEKWLQLAEDGWEPIAAYDRLAAIRMPKLPIYRSINARYHGDYPAAIALSQSGLDQTPVTEIRDRGIALLFLSHAHFYAGNTDTAERVLADAVPTNLASGHYSAYINACHHLAKLRVLQGHLREAREIYEQAALAVSGIVPPVTAGVEFACLGDLYREWNHLESAASKIQQGIELAEASDHIFFLTDVYIARVRLALAQKDWETASSILQKAEQVVHRCPGSVEIELLRAWRARLHLAQGDLADAGLWAEMLETKLKEAEIACPFDPQREFELLTLARIWLAQGKAEQAVSLLEQICNAAEDAGRHGRALEARMLLALAEQAAAQDAQAIERFNQVLAQAEPEGYVRMFIDEGAPMARLLYKLTSRTTGHLRDYAERLMSAYSHEGEELRTPLSRSLQVDVLIKPLSERELEVLRLVAAGKTNLEIADELYLALGTVKRHTVNIFTKLDVDNRTEAVSRARQLGLL